MKNNFSKEELLGDNVPPSEINEAEEIVESSDEPIVEPFFAPDDTMTSATSPIPPSILTPTKIQQTRESTRGILALIFILGFYIMLLIGILFVAMHDDVSLEEQVKSLQDVLLALSGVLAGPLGFVVGYYFRKQDEQS